jgi:hypothetical protein
MMRGLGIPVICFLSVIGLIELTIQEKFHPGFWQKSTWLTFDPYQGATFDRVEAFTKLDQLTDTEPDIISVGDSSGFFSLQSNIINRYIKPYKYVNFSTGANQAFDGYKAMAEYTLQRAKHIKYVVLYMYPDILPLDEVVAQGDLGRILYADIIGPKAYVTPPSAGLSPYAKFSTFYGVPYDPTGPLSSHEPTLEFSKSARTTLGWLHEYDIRFDRVYGHVPFYSDERVDWYNRYFGDPSAIHERLSDFNKMVRGYGAQLVIAFAPLPTTVLRAPQPNIDPVQTALAKFQTENPEVKFLFPFLTPLGPEKFGQYNHISLEYSFISSARLGKALAKLTAEPSSIPPFTPRPYEPITLETPFASSPLSPATRPALDAAMALYLYAATADDKYRALISRRSLAELDRDENFQFQLHDTKDRLAMFTQDGVKIGFDISKLNGTPTVVQGMPFCNLQSDTHWVQIAGTISFTYSSSSVVSAEPISWPEASHILIPTRIEDGVEKFDGYCPEPSQRN